MVSKDYLSRLAFIRHLYQTGVDQSQQPYPLSAKSLLTFHDAVEMFLVLGMMYLNSGGDPKIGFDKYIIEINKALSTKSLALSGQVKVNSLNKARVNFKHHGNYPALPDIEIFRNTASDFLKDNAPIIFDGLDFNDVSMADLVVLSTAREFLQEAEQYINKDDFGGAMTKIAISFQEIMHYIDTHSNDIGVPSFFSFDETKQFTWPYLKTKFDDLDNFIKNTSTSIYKMQSFMKIMLLGIDAHKYHRFTIITPSVKMNVQGEIIARFHKGLVVDKNKCQEAFDFVVSSAIQLQGFIDFSLPEVDFPLPEEA